MQGAEVSPDVDVTKNKFAINVAFPSSSADDAIRLILEDVSHAPYVLLLTVLVRLLTIILLLLLLLSFVLCIMLLLLTFVYFRCC